MAATDTTVEEFRELEDPEAAARAAGLRYVSDEDPGLTRRRRGTGWSYYPPDDTRITDLEERDRLNALAVPPAWTDVWICPRPDGHIQATGRDDRGRKQYRYHPDWRAVRDLAKFARMVPFGQALPRIRRRTAAHLRKEGLPREKVLAAVIRLLERSLIRVGNSEYTNANGSYGLTTLRDRHVDFRGSRVRFEFRGKGGKQLFVELEDPRLARIVRQCRDVPGYDLFQYYDENGERRTVGSGDVNQYLREIAGEEFSAKDFRTWAGTLHAALALQECGPCSDEPEAKRRVGESIEKVAERLGNTPAVCRACYVHPAVIECYLDGTLADRMGSGAGGPARPAKVRGLSAEESAVLALLGA
ncbi:MAG TPA: DNA topoisomerase IB [Gemmatimonadota bacterium]|nr:DNA topoisomerase IB [Gemmatimonadota bacterium]